MRSPAQPKAQMRSEPEIRAPHQTKGQTHTASNKGKARAADDARAKAWAPSVDKARSEVVTRPDKAEAHVFEGLETHVFEECANFRPRFPET